MGGGDDDTNARPRPGAAISFSDQAAHRTKAISGGRLSTTNHAITNHNTMVPRRTIQPSCTARRYKPQDRGTFTVRRDEPPAVIVDRGTTAVNTTTTTPSQPTFLLVREHTLPRRNQRYGGIKDITVRHRTMINDCRFLPSSWVWEASTSIHSRSLCCLPIRCYVLQGSAYTIGTTCMVHGTHTSTIAIGVRNNS